MGDQNQRQKVINITQEINVAYFIILGISVLIALITAAVQLWRGFSGSTIITSWVIIFLFCGSLIGMVAGGYALAQIYGDGDDEEVDKSEGGHAAAWIILIFAVIAFIIFAYMAQRQRKITELFDDDNLRYLDPTSQIQRPRRKTFAEIAGLTKPQQPRRKRRIPGRSFLSWDPDDVERNAWLRNNNVAFKPHLRM